MSTSELLEYRIGELEKKVMKLESMQLKLVLFAATGSGIGGGVVTGLIKFFG